METKQACIEELNKQLKKGYIQKGYKAILDCLIMIRSSIQKKHPEYICPGTFYQGYFDMSYFAVMTPMLKNDGLKIAVVFNYTDFRFEIWLSASNKSIQKKYWSQMRDYPWKGYKVVSTVQGNDSILEYVVEERLEDLENILKVIEGKVETFIEDIEAWIQEKEYA
jgi:hypothetical protein